MTWGLVLSYLLRAARTVRDLRDKVGVFGVVELRKMFFEGFEMKEEVRLKVTGAEEGVWGVVYWNEVAAVAAAEMEAIRGECVWFKGGIEIRIWGFLSGNVGGGYGAISYGV
ncbi:hypothetical protein Tco_0903314 [Tanacetum coccineum]